jgi:hypothetical protein
LYYLIGGDMNRDQLQALSLEELKELAMEEGVALIKAVNRDSLVEQLIEAFSDDEGEADNNPAMVIKEKKFDLMKPSREKAERLLPYGNSLSATTRQRSSSSSETLTGPSPTGISRSRI